jgi:arylsulfatase A-like enzyme
MSRPNIVFLLMDDLGWRDLGCFGSTFYETPNLDRLAAEGMRFTDAYAACPVCSPTRASLLTGRYPARVGITDWIDWGGRLHPARGRLIDAPYLRQLPPQQVTLASALREGGYATWHVGKWHLGGAGSLPQDHGFDLNFGGSHAGCPYNGYFSPWKLPNLPDGPSGQYLPDRLMDEAMALIRGHDGRRPFFLNFWDYLVHTPIQAKPEIVERFARKARRLGLDRVQALEECEPFPCQHKRNLKVTRRRLQSDPVYAAMVWSMDENIGRLLRVLEETGQAENTLIVYTSDNGGLATSEGSPTCNAPLEEGKGWMYEGGVREPLLVRWPGHVRPGSLCDVPLSSPDLYPTLLEAAGLPPRPEQHCDGVSLLPLLTERGVPPREALFWHYPHYGNQGGTPGASVRCGDHKLIEFYEDGRLELYNLRTDLSETQDLLDREPGVAHRLKSLLDAWRADVAARIPQPNPEWAAPTPPSVAPAPCRDVARRPSAG